MEGSSTHHIAVTKRMMARKRAKRAVLNQRKESYYKGRFGDIKNNLLADRFRSNTSGHLVRERRSLSTTDRAYLWVVAITAVLVSAVLYWVG